MPPKVRLEFEGAVYHLLDRGESAGACYHLMSRSDRREEIFGDDSDRGMNRL
jgi:hypothetical protein